eukprot:TRINITY_DN5272_c0_g2_i1.p1 TRINITY_DN5272_c0_g2~~TRINITY_DN5272_c0_g2_i1.p1  ORF type:complete len:746 (-),score=111.34 TRINITY_DN5272_c0_g2_i1:157-2394(-)
MASPVDGFGSFLARISDSCAQLHRVHSKLQDDHAALQEQHSALQEQHSALQEKYSALQKQLQDHICSSEAALAERNEGSPTHRSSKMTSGKRESTLSIPRFILTSDELEENDNSSEERSPPRSPSRLSRIRSSLVSAVSRKSLRSQVRNESDMDSNDGSILGRRSTMRQSMWQPSSRTRLRELCSQRLNLQRQRLQALLADLDPEEQGQWMQEELDAEQCLELLNSQGHFPCDLETMQEILQALLGSGDGDACISICYLVDLTSMSRLENALDPQNFEIAMLLRDAAIWDVTNKLLNTARLERTASVSDLLVRAVSSLQRPANNRWLSWLDGVMTVLVLANVVIIGVSTDVNPNWYGWDVVNAVFAVSFLLELVFKLRILGCRGYFCGKANLWNIFDALLALIASVDIATLIIRLVGTEEVDTWSLSLMRMVRLSRLSRVARLARTPIFQELSHMLRGIAAGSRTLVWAFILTISVSYVFGVFLTQMVGYDDMEGRFADIRERHFSSVMSSMFTVFRCCTGDCTTFDGKPLPIAMHAMYGTSVYITYMAALMIVNLGLFNVIISIFVQNTQRASKFSDEERRKFLSKHRKRVANKTHAFIHRAWAIFKESDAGRESLTVKTPDISSLQINRASFAEIVKDPEINRVLDDLGLEETNRMTLFDLLDVESQGKLVFTDLVQSLLRIGKNRDHGMEELNLMMKAIHHRLVYLEGCLIYRQEAQKKTENNEISAQEEISEIKGNGKVLI